MVKNVGIDYGCGISNIDLLTNIRYGVIPSVNILDWWAEESEPFYDCENCEDKDYENNNCDFCEPVFHFIKNDDLRAESDRYGDIFVVYSKVYTYACYCSPCAPGACDLLSPHRDGQKCYCISSVNFHQNNCPYPVFSVKSNELLYDGPNHEFRDWYNL